MTTGAVHATIMLVGDSNIAFALSALAFEMTGEKGPSFVLVDAARAGTGIRHPTSDFWAARLRELAARLDVDGYVVNLGINDTTEKGSTTSRGYGNYGAKVDWLMGVLDERPVWWTNLPCDIVPPRRQSGCHAVNEALAAAQARWPNLCVLDWCAVAAGQGAYLVENRGGVHLSAHGSIAWAHLVGQAVKTYRFGGH